MLVIQSRGGASLPFFDRRSVVTVVATKKRGDPLVPSCHGRFASLVDAAQQGVDAHLGASLGIHLLDDDGAVQAVGAALGGQGA